MSFAVWAMWVSGLLCWIAAAILLCLAWQGAHAAELAIISHSSGIGLHSLNVSADWINTTIQNSTIQIQAGGWQ